MLYWFQVYSTVIQLYILYIYMCVCVCVHTHTLLQILFPYRLLQNIVYSFQFLLPVLC